VNLKSIKKIDRFAGWAICSLLALHNALMKPFRMRSDSPPKNILLIKFFGMGSIVLAQPLLKMVRTAYPGARIHFLTFSSNVGVLDLFGNSDEVLQTEVKPLHKFIIDTLRILLLLRRKKIDIAFNLEFFSRYTSIVTYLSGARKRVEFYSEVLWRGNLFTTGVKFNPYLHVKDNFLRLAEVAGVAGTAEPAPRPSIANDITTHISDMLQAHGIGPSDRKICINVNAGDLAIERRWPEQRFIELIDRLSAHPVKIILIGARNDAPYVEQVVNKVKDRRSIVNLAGKTSIKELAAVFQLCDLTITSDSGPLHLADAVGATTVSFFGPETPVLYGPRNGRNLVFYRAEKCSPCLDVLNAKTVSCDYHVQCMTGISAEEVHTALLRQYPELFSGQEK
jgi:ADP-heptose:LPS heptosyltransferase